MQELVEHSTEQAIKISGIAIVRGVGWCLYEIQVWLVHGRNGKVLWSGFPRDYGNGKRTKR